MCGTRIRRPGSEARRFHSRLGCGAPLDGLLLNEDMAGSLRALVYISSSSSEAMPMPARNCSWLSTNDSKLSAECLIRRGMASTEQSAK